MELKLTALQADEMANRAQITVDEPEAHGVEGELRHHQSLADKLWPISDKGGLVSITEEQRLILLDYADNVKQIAETPGNADLEPQWAGCLYSMRNLINKLTLDKG